MGCTGGNNSDRAREDSIRRADSLAKVEADLARAKEDSIMMDSLLLVEAAEIYKDAVTIKPGEKLKKHVPESSFYKVDWTCTVVNNSGITMTPADYQVTYDETFEDGNADGLFEVTKQRT